MLDQARTNLRGSRATLEFRAGEIDRLPLGEAEVDAVVAGMVLHHAPDLLAFTREAWRALRPGGVLVIQDLLPHRESGLRETMADFKLGLVPDEVASLLREVGFLAPVVELVDDSYTPARPDGGRADLPLFLVRGRKPAADRSPNT
jgi:ArsR family transcriptional regulator